jgi:hypothetical protein
MNKLLTFEEFQLAIEEALVDLPPAEVEAYERRPLSDWTSLLRRQAARTIAGYGDEG